MILNNLTAKAQSAKAELFDYNSRAINKSNTSGPDDEEEEGDSAGGAVGRF